MTDTTATMPTAATGICLAVARTFAFIIWTVSILPFAIVSKVTVGNTATLRLLYFRVLCRLFGLSVVVHGQITPERPVLIASNHISYLDVLAFGAVAELEFVSKAEVASWPVLGLLAKLGDTTFVERRRTQTRQARDDMAGRLSRGRCVVFFPEATSGDGNSLLPFKSALFTVAEPSADSPLITVQPAVIAYTRLNGLPLGFGWTSFFAWYGDMTMAAHVWRFLQLGRTTVEIVLLEPVRPDQFGHGPQGRKALAAAVERSCRSGFARLRSGRLAP